MGTQRHLSRARTNALIVLLAVVALLVSACTQAPVGPPLGATGRGRQVRCRDHSLDLDSIDLTRQAVLRTTAGELAPTSWAAPKAGHHRSGELVFPQVLLDGRPAIATGSVQLVIRDVGGIPKRVFSWQP